MSRCDGRSPLTSSSPMKICPDVSSSRPAMQRSVVVLPQPDGPSITNSSPSADREVELLDRDRAVGERLVQPLDQDFGH